MEGKDRQQPQILLDWHPKPGEIPANVPIHALHGLEVVVLTFFIYIDKNSSSR
jgi:hypothetical protein